MADAGLGTINSLVLTVRYMESRNLPVKGVIFNHFHKGDVMEEDNVFMCEKMTGLKTLALVGDGDANLDIDFGTLSDIYS